MLLAVLAVSEHAAIVGEDIDLLIILKKRTQAPLQEIFFKLTKFKHKYTTPKVRIGISPF